MERLKPTLAEIRHTCAKGWDKVVPRQASLGEVLGRAIIDSPVLGLGARTVRDSLAGDIGYSYHGVLFLLAACLAIRYHKSLSARRKR